MIRAYGKDPYHALPEVLEMIRKIEAEANATEALADVLEVFPESEEPSREERRKILALRMKARAIRDKAFLVAVEAKHRASIDPPDGEEVVQ